MKFSHTEWGDLGKSQDVSFTLGQVIQFFFACRTDNSFPTLPPLSEFLPKVYRNVSTFLG